MNLKHIHVKGSKQFPSQMTAQVLYQIFLTISLSQIMPNEKQLTP